MKGNHTTFHTYNFIHLIYLALNFYKFGILLSVNIEKIHKRNASVSMFDSVLM